MAAPVAAIPFTRAARKKTAAAGILTGTVPSSATQLQPVQIPAAGYLAGIEILVDVTTAGNSATTAFKTAASAGDAPWSFINSINLVNSAGDNLMSNVTGYHLMLLNKYGNFRTQAPFCDPRADQYFSVTTGAGGTGGSFRFRLFIPIQADPSQAFCALPNLAANKSYLVNIQLAANTAVYSTAPTSAGTYTIQFINHYWSQPAGTNAVGVPQQIAPDGVGSVMLTQLQTISVGGAGDKILQLQNVGNVIKSLIFVLRDSSGIRTVANSWGNTNQIILNNDTLFYWTTGTNSSSSWSSHMSEAWGYGEALNGTAPGTASTLDAAGGLDTNVFAVGYFNDLNGGYVAPNTNRNQFLPTLDATLLQLRSTSFGANAQTLEVLTQSVKPTTAAALYAPHN